MKFSTGLLVAAAAGIASAQVSYDNSTDTWKCPVANGSYCAGDSLSTSVIILCTNGIGWAGSCDGHAQARPPIDVYTAPCWQISPTAGNATCSKNCTVFPDQGNPFAVPGQCTHVGADANSNTPGYGFGTNGTTSPYSNSTSNATATSTRSGPATPTGPTSTASATHSSAAIAMSAGASSSIFGLALFAVAAFGL